MKRCTMRYAYTFLLSLFFLSKPNVAKSPIDEALSPLTSVNASTPTPKKNEAILKSYYQFEKALKNSDYYTSHSTYFTESDPGFICPAFEYYTFLSSKSVDTNVADILEYLLRTNGPFIQTTRKATEAETFVLKVAATAVRKAAGKKVEHPNIPQEEKSFQNIKEKHSPSESLSLPSQQDRWDSLIDLVQNGSFFDSTSFDLSLNTEKLFFTNDLILLGYSLGLIKRLTPNAAIGPTLGLTPIWQEWKMTNHNMEDAHNYVQAWFPIFSVGLGDGKQTQRLSPTLMYNLESTKCLELLNQMNKITWARMTTFWGQKIDGAKLSMADSTWQKNWLTNTHNDARMTRILTWLLMFRREDEYKMMQAYLSASKKNSFWDNKKLRKQREKLEKIIERRRSSKK